MVQRPLFAIALLLLLSSASPAIATPKPDKNGDYSGRTSHQNWLVVDPDPNGLNCRWHSAAPSDWYSPAAQLPKTPIASWRIVRRFKKNTSLTANLAPAGFATMMDNRQKPWLKVSIGPNEQICLVRANAQYIRPIQR